VRVVIYIDATHPAGRLLRLALAAANTGIEAARLCWQLAAVAGVAGVLLVCPGAWRYVRKDVTK
jgi:membrane protein implicated in regulation of membrane protease activity